MLQRFYGCLQFLKWQWISILLVQLIFLLSPTRLLQDLTIGAKWRVSYKKQELPTLTENLGSPPVFSGVRFPDIFSFLCFVCLRSVFCVPNVVCVPGLSIIEGPFVFL